MINYLKKFFGHNSQNMHDTVINPTPYENSISIVLDISNRPMIRINIQNLDEQSIKKFAESLFILNKGGYQIDIIETLKELALKDNSRTESIGKMFSHWGNYIDSFNNITYDDNSPAVSPTSFFKLVINNNEH